MNCVFCGQPIRRNDAYIKSTSGNLWHVHPCTEVALGKWDYLEEYERLAEEPGRYKAGIRRAIEYMIDAELCVDPRKRCNPTAEDCMKCWIEELTGDKEE